MKLIDTVAKILAAKGNQVFSIVPTASVFEAVELLSTRNIGAVLVMDGAKLAGIFSERDYARKVVLKGKSSRQTPVSEIMASPVVTVTPDHRVEECMQLMARGRFRHLPVVSGERVVGVVSIGDLVTWIIDAQEEAIQHLEGYISGKYPG